MNPFQNPLEQMFLRLSASSGAQALVTAGMLVGLIGVLGVSLRDDATAISTVLMVVTAGTGFVAMFVWRGCVGSGDDGGPRPVETAGPRRPLVVPGIVRGPDRRRAAALMGSSFLGEGDV